MSEQLETIKCVDWTINFPGAVGGGADGGESPSVEAGGPPRRCTWSVTPPFICPRKATGLFVLQTGREC